MINVYLIGNLYQQVKIAYSIPLKISLITIGDKGMFNIFPTDINGSIDANNFVISLRKTGKANHQVKEQRKLVVSEMRSESYSEIYSYVVNHMRGLQPSDKFSFSEDLSKSFKLPLPKNILLYIELEFVNEMVIGIHNIIFFRLVSSSEVDDSNTLAHIHRDYAQWRINNGLLSEFLFR